MKDLTLSTFTRASAKFLLDNELDPLIGFAELEHLEKELLK